MTMNDISPEVLGGIRILDMTRVIAGPYAGQILADLGAEVIKVERQGEGDDIRRIGPPWIKGTENQPHQESTYSQAANRNKRSITVDFAQPEGAELIRQLVANCDVLLENYRTGTLARYGLGYEDLSKINPRLIYCSITGFGQTGPYANRSGYDYLIQAMAGVMSVTGHREGEPGDGPMRVGIPVADICAGLYAAIGVLGALNHRNSSGEGQHIDVSLFDAQVATLLNTFSAWFNGGKELGRTGNDHPSASPYGVYPVDDGFILIATFNDREFVRLAKAVGREDWIEDPRFARNGARVANRRELSQQLTEALRGQTKAEWIEHLNANTVSCGPINNMQDLELDPHVIEREMIVSQEHPLNGTVRSAASPMRFSATPVRYKLAPPTIGEHTEAVLGEWLGLSAERIAELRQRNVI
ncbi:Acetyl-CoA:oxalate CoA-transferase [compost metagenome]|jgi:crotonobetainyl-CoA:carnitine CoA-transferase CaiB-like acyl-CoA transferase|uniref:CaiB/BaiF CoA transferase family protein n=1 Tax=Metapseudomonas furukawaii TaxID=1149133 RepID=UPI00227C4DE2|nr:CaiB/BaiF CoA-transferase family protein [Pseudomonas furukawaii]WAG81046.1 CoA transferase [Pseudomonas furukawaii]